MLVYIRVCMRVVCIYRVSNPDQARNQERGTRVYTECRTGRKAENQTRISGRYEGQDWSQKGTQRMMHIPIQWGRGCAESRVESRASAGQPRR